MMPFPPHYRNFGHSLVNHVPLPFVGWLGAEFYILVTAMLSVIDDCIARNAQYTTQNPG